MAERHVVVTLHPVYFPDSLPFRSLTFTSDKPTVPIGRSSKSEMKNLVPAHDNGWFDSRVMSRNHAALSVSFDKKTVFIRELESMHGTTLNDKKITPKINVPVQDGDVLMFGSEVSRGSETFRPVAVRCNCQWFESQDSHPKPTDSRKSTTNTFSVPDDEDDVAEVGMESLLGRAVSQPKRIRVDSSDEYGSDSSRPVDLTSPATSPEANVTEVSGIPTSINNVVPDPANADSHDGSIDSPILLDCDRQAPRSTPPGGFPILQQTGHPETDSEESFAGNDSDSDVDEDENGTDGEVEVDEAADIVDSESENESEEDEQEEDDDDDDTDGLFSQLRPRSVAGLERPSPSPRVSPDQDHLSPFPSQVREKAINSIFTRQHSPKRLLSTLNTTAGAQVPSTYPTAATGSVLEASPFNEEWFEHVNPRVPSPSDKAMAKSSQPPPPTYPSDDFWNTWAPNQLPLPSHQMPFPSFSPSPLPYSHTAQESFPFGPLRSSEGYLSHFGNRLADTTKRYGSASSDALQTNRVLAAEPDSLEAKLRTVLEPVESTVNTTRVSIADIVDKASGEANSSPGPNPLKRKATEFEASDSAAPVNNTADSQQDLSESSPPDAQPQPDVKDILLTDSQLLQINSPVEASSGRTACERRRKRVRTTHAGTFVKYATVAAMGAIVGGIGTVATLASLPTDFFG